MHLAQLNIAEGRYPMTDARMTSFTGRLKAIQSLAERSPGFVWRDLTDGEDADFSDLASAERKHGLIVNISVWDSVKSLFAFTYKTAHAKVMQDNRDNFNPLAKNHFVLWWIAKGKFPTGLEAKEKLLYLRANGASPEAFTFNLPFSQTGQPIKFNFPKKDCA